MLLFARHGTGVAADTSILVDDEAIAHKEIYIVSAPGESLRRGPNRPTTGARRVSNDLLSGHVEFNAPIAGAAFLGIVRRDRAVFSESLRCHTVVDTLD